MYKKEKKRSALVIPSAVMEEETSAAADFIAVLLFTLLNRRKSTRRESSYWRIEKLKLELMNIMRERFDAAKWDVRRPHAAWWERVMHIRSDGDLIKIYHGNVHVTDVLMTLRTPIRFTVHVDPGRVEYVSYRPYAGPIRIYEKIGETCYRHLRNALRSYHKDHPTDAKFRHCILGYDTSYTHE